mgnify:CR=1 FL=1
MRTFAGALVGSLARMGEVNDDNLVRAVHIGTCMASFVVEEFSLDRLLNIKPGELKKRTDKVFEMVALPKLDNAVLEDHCQTQKA